MTHTPHATRALPLLGAYYFACLGALGAIFPFAPLLFSERGLSPSEIGWVMFLLPVSNVTAPPLWGVLADRFRARVTVLRWTSLSCIPAVFLFLPGHGFAGTFIAMCVFSYARAPLIPLADAVAHDCLGHQRARFAYVRVWGSVGFAICAFLAGQIDASRSPLAFVSCAAVLYLVATLSTLGIPPSASETTHRSRPPDVLRRALAHAKSSGLLLLFLGHVIYYIGHSIFDVFFGLHARALGATDGFIGLAWGLGVTCEVVLMTQAPPLLMRYRASSLLVVAALAATLRWLSMSMIEEPMWFLAVQPLHAITFGLWYLAMTKMIQERTDEGLRASVQSFAMASMGFGMGLGYLLGGQLFEHHGGRTTFGVAAVFAFTAALVYGSMRRPVAVH